MNANELRMGNLYLGYDDLTQQVDLQVFVNLNNGVDLDEMIKSRIALTEEWLLLNGFEKTSFDNIKITDSCVIDAEGKTIGFYSDYHEDDITFKLPEYVHQFQNLFFVVTGQDLCITQP